MDERIAIFSHASVDISQWNDKVLSFRVFCLDVKLKNFVRQQTNKFMQDSTYCV